MRRFSVTLALLLIVILAIGRDCPAAKPATVAPRQVGRYMRLWVIGGGETITLRDPFGRSAQATDTTAWSRIPACSTGVNPPLRSGDNMLVKMDGGFFFVKEPLVGSWLLEVRRDAAPRSSTDKGPNVGVYAERHSLSDSNDWADERDHAWLAKGQTMAWHVIVAPPAAADSTWLHLTREGTKKR